MKCQACGNEFEGKFCPECGTPAPPPALCPNCGAPVSGKFCAECGTPVSSASVPAPQAALQPDADTEPEPVQFRATKQCGRILVDTDNRLWRVAGLTASSSGVPKQTSSGHKLAKGALAFMTAGMSLAAEAAVKGVSKLAAPKESIPTYTYDQLVSYDLLEDDEAITSGGIGQALVGGALFGGFGAVAGGVTAKRKTKKVVNSITIKLTVNDFSRPCIMLPLLAKPAKTNSKEYQAAYTLAQQMLSLLDVITHNA